MSAADLEVAAPGRATLLVHLSLHRAVLSETALRRLDIAASTHDPFGDIARGRRGAPNGLVWESVFGRALTTALLDTASTMSRQGVDELLLAEATGHLALGITACHDPCIPGGFEPAMERLATRTPLRLSWSRVSPGGILDPLDDAEVAGRGCGQGPASAKLFLDGAHRCALCLDVSHVLAMAGRAIGNAMVKRRLRPLRDLMELRTTYRHPHVHVQYLRFDEASLIKRLSRLAEAGARPKIHALGNEAVAQACRALRMVGTRDATLEHLMFTSARDVESVARSGAIASLQPGFIAHYGPELLERGLSGRLKVLAAASLLRVGVPLALSSDYPCGPLDPLHNLRQAVGRRLADGRGVEEEEAIGVSEAIDAYTAGGCHAIHGRRGFGLAVGAPADFVMLSGSPFRPETRVLRTWVRGQEVWTAPAASAAGTL